MESALYGIYALVVFVSEIVLVRQHFPWSILYLSCLYKMVICFCYFRQLSLLATGSEKYSFVVAVF